MKLSTVLLLLSFSLNLNYPAVAEEVSAGTAEKSGERWSVERIQDWQKREGWRVGANFLPSTAINQHEMWSAATWDPETLKRELDLVRDTGMNTLRVFLHDRTYAEDAEGFLKRLDLFLSMCAERGIKPMLVFFDDCWLSPSQVPTLIPAPRPGTHNSGWLQSPGSDLVRAYPTDKALQQRLRSYVQSVIRRFANDPRILAWDLFNEPGNRANRRFDEKGQELPGDHRLPPEIKGDCALLRDVFQWAREINPQQPLTSGVWTGLTPAPSPVVRLQLENSDFISFHSYGKLDVVKGMVAQLRKNAPGRPLLCSEYMARNNGCTFEAILPFFAAENISAMSWGFVDGKSQTKYGWSSWKQPEPDEPKLWLHDLYRKDGTPYRQAEVDLIRKLSAEKKKGA
jgi:hypothetical protein